MWEIDNSTYMGDYLYALIPSHPSANSNGYVLEHRVVMENHIGRPLTSNEIVHHKDGNKMNNKIDNLELMLRTEHTSMHSKLRHRTKEFCKLLCPNCEQEFERAKRLTSILFGARFTCCSKSCKASFDSKLKIEGLSLEYKKRIASNLIEIYSRTV
jgi:hypothetical protein